MCHWAPSLTLVRRLSCEFHLPLGLQRVTIGGLFNPGNIKSYYRASMLPPYFLGVAMAEFKLFLLRILITNLGKLPVRNKYILRK